MKKIIIDCLWNITVKVVFQVTVTVPLAYAVNLFKFDIPSQDIQFSFSNFTIGSFLYSHTISPQIILFIFEANLISKH